MSSDSTRPLSPQPTYMRALTQGSTPGHATLRDDVAIPQCKHGQVVVRVLFAGQNPSDAFALDPVLSSLYRNENNVLGSDFYGVVITTTTTHVPVGVHVCGWVAGGCTTNGAFAEYVVCDADMLIAVPANRTPAADAMAALPFSFFTALHALSIGLQLDVSNPIQNATRPTNEPIVLWGAGTACGFYAAQILQHAGFRVIAVAGHEACQRLLHAGVHAITFDRSQGDEQHIAQLIQRTVPDITNALDCHASYQSIQACVQSLDTNRSGGRVHCLLPPQRSSANGAPTLCRNDVSLTFALVHGMQVDHRLSILSMQPAIFSTPESRAQQHTLAVRWASYDRGLLHAMLRDDKLRLLPVVRWPLTSDQRSGLEGIQEVLRRAAANEKLPRGKIVHAMQGY